MTTVSEKITLGGGCFWCLEAVFERVQGVSDVESGYCNGHVIKPTYEQVCGGLTGHVEVVRLTFEPQKISLYEVLEIFFLTHDPTTLNRQGNDVGTQYRSGIYFESAPQGVLVNEWMAQLRLKMPEPVVTEVQALRNYSRAESHHQHYFALHPEQGYCAYVIAPKVEKFKKTFARHVRS
jgi:peptide-methionine (S)-S-oxide reductase